MVVIGLRGSKMTAYKEEKMVNNLAVSQKVANFAVKYKAGSYVREIPSNCK